MSRDLQRSTTWWLELAATSQHRSAAPRRVPEPKKGKPKLDSAEHGFFGLIGLDAHPRPSPTREDGLWTGSRRSVVQISSFGGNLWRERTVTFGSRGRRPEVASTANAQPLPIPAAGAPAAPETAGKAPAKALPRAARGNSPSKLPPPPPVKPEWTPKPRRPSRPAAPSSRSSRPSGRRGP